MRCLWGRGCDEFLRDALTGNRISIRFCFEHLHRRDAVENSRMV